MIKLVRFLALATLAALIAPVANAQLVIEITRGQENAVPIAIVPFGWELTLDRFKAIGATPHLRYAADKPFITDNSNYIADW